MQSETNFGTLRRRAWIVVLFLLLGVAIGAVPAPQKAQDATISYQATHTMLLSSTSGSLYTDPVQLNQIQLFATTGEVPKRVAAKLAMDLGAVSISPALDQSTGALQITANKSDPEVAVLVADTVADELSKYIAERQDAQQEGRLATNLARQQELEGKIRDLEDQVALRPNDNVVGAQLDALRGQYTVVVQKYDELTADVGYLQLNTLQMASPVAITSQGLQAPRSRSTRGVLGGLLGLTVGAGLALLLGRLDRRVRTRAQAELQVGMRAQVVVPVAGASSLAGVVVTPNRHDALSDSFRALRTVVAFAEGGKAKAEGRAPVVVVVSAGPSEGKTSVTANLAAAFMESGNKTIAINTDFRRPALAQRILGMPLTLTSVSLQEAQTRGAAELMSLTLNPNLAMVDFSSIKGNPGDLTRLTMRVLPDLTKLCDVVVVDTSPITATAEVLELIPLADVVVLAVRLDQTPTQGLSRTVELLQSLHPANMLLTVVGDSSERATYYNYSKDEDAARPGRRWKRKR